MVEPEAKASVMLDHRTAASSRYATVREGTSFTGQGTECVSHAAGLAIPQAREMLLIGRVGGDGCSTDRVDEGVAWESRNK